MFNASLLEILVCPETKQRLSLLENEKLVELNARISRGELHSRAGQVVTVPLDEALVREDGQFAYAVRDDIPIMLIEEAISLNS